MLMQALGQNTGASATSYANTTNQLRQTASKMGVNPGDPRMVSAFNSASEASTKANLPEVQAILSLFGMNPQSTISGMGAGQSAGSSTSQNMSPLQTLGSVGSLGVQGLSMAALLALL